MLDKLIHIDTRLFLWLNSFHSPCRDSIMWHISGKPEWIPLYLLLLGVIIYKYRWKSIAVILAVSLTITLADQLAVKAFKEVFMRLRPSHEPALEGLVHLVNDYRGGQYGFVSNHAANSFGLAVFISYLFKNKYVTTGMLVWACVVSYSRIYLGVHYPADILGGALLGAGIASFMYFLLVKILWGSVFQKKVKRE